MLDELIDLRAVGGGRRALVKGDLVDAPAVLELIEQSDQRLADRSGADDMHDVLFRRHPVTQIRRRIVAVQSPAPWPPNPMPAKR